MFSLELCQLRSCPFCDVIYFLASSFRSDKDSLVRGEAQVLLGIEGNILTADKGFLLTIVTEQA